jgi:hypothetical protein
MSNSHLSCNVLARAAVSLLLAAAIGAGWAADPPVITSALAAAGTSQVALTYQITATNAPTSFAATGLPAGLAINTTTGAISGTPTADGISNVAISATGAGGTGSATLVLTIHAKPVITSWKNLSVRISSPMSYQITANGATIASYSVTGSLPAGLSFNAATAVISGTPTVSGVYNITIGASNPAGYRTTATLGLAIAGTTPRQLYVSGAGSNAKDGLSVANAWQTLGKAASQALPGDTVWILDGPMDTVRGRKLYQESFTLRNDGFADAPITWKAYPGQHPELFIINSWGLLTVAASWQIIDGLVLTGPNDELTLADAEADYAAASPNGRYNTNGILVDNRNAARKTHHLTVRNCTVRKFPGAGIATIEADYTVIEYCDIYENAWYSRYGCSGGTIFPHNADPADPNTGYRNFIRGNRFWNNRGLVKWKQIDAFSDGNGFILDITATNYAGRTLITDNLAVNNGGSGIHAYRGVRADIVNNTGYMNGQKVGYPDIYAGYSTDVRLLNNIMYSKVGGKANSNGGNTSVVYDYNIYFNGTRAVTGAHDIVADPLFVAPGLDPLTADFRLRPGSPAIDSGTTITGTTSVRDQAGIARPVGAGLDRGAYEYANLAPVISMPASAAPAVLVLP